MHICLFAAIFCTTTLTPVLAQAAPPSKVSPAVAAPKAAEPPKKPPTAARSSSKSGMTLKAEPPQKPPTAERGSSRPVITIKVDPPTEQAPAAQPDAADRLFIRLIAASTGMAADIGELAAEKASNDNVKTFGAQMLESNLTTQAWIEDLARQHGVTLPTEQQAEQKTARARLEPLEGLPFDMAYLQHQLIEHQKTLQLLQWEISFGKDVQVQRLAMEMLPTVLNRLQNVQILMNETADLALANPAAASPPQVVPEEIPQEMAEDNVQEPVQQTAQQAAQQPAEKTTGKATGRTAEKATGKTAEKVAEKVAERVAKKAADKVAERGARKAAGKVTEEKADERFEEKAENKAENNAETDVMSTIRRL